MGSDRFCPKWQRPSILLPCMDFVFMGVGGSYGITASNRVANMGSKMKITDEEIEAARSPKGGWTRKQLAKWGVSWPPPKGWRKALVAGEPVPNRGASKTWKDAIPKEVRQAHGRMTQEFKDIVGRK